MLDRAKLCPHLCHDIVPVVGCVAVAVIRVVRKRIFGIEVGCGGTHRSGVAGVIPSHIARMAAVGQVVTGCEDLADGMVRGYMPSGVGTRPVTSTLACDS